MVLQEQAGLLAGLREQGLEAQAAELASLHVRHKLLGYRHTTSLLALLFVGSLLSACDAISTARSQHFAHRYYEGQALQLAIAAEHGDVRRVQRLMKDKGVNPDTVFGGSDRYPLVAWPLMSRNLEGLRALLENGADPNARYPEIKKKYATYTTYYNNAMVYAAKLEDPRFLELLLEYGGNPDTRNSNDETLLFTAFISGNLWKTFKPWSSTGPTSMQKTSCAPIPSWVTTPAAAGSTKPGG